MMTGTDYYQCTNCGNYLQTGCVISDNTADAELFSDGKIIAPMMCEFPNLTKCKKCDTILWFRYMETISGMWKEENKTKSENAEEAEFLDVSDLLRFLDLDSVKNDKQKERYVREEIWWTFNNRIREGKEIFSEKFEEILFQWNCQCLIELLDETDVSQKIMIVELYRNLGKFDACVELLNSINDDEKLPFPVIPQELDRVIETLKRECEKGNRLLVKIEY